MTALEYTTELVGKDTMRLLPLTEDEALQGLILSHRRLREYNSERMDWWYHAPRWKVRIAKWLRVP